MSRLERMYTVIGVVGIAIGIALLVHGDSFEGASLIAESGIALWVLSWA